MIRRPLVWFSIMYVCGIIICDKIYSGAILELIPFIVVLFIGGILYYRYLQNGTFIDFKQKKIYFGFIFFFIGLLQTIFIEKDNLTYVEYNQNNISIIGTVHSIEEKNKSYGITLYCDNNYDQYNKNCDRYNRNVNVYNKNDDDEYIKNEYKYSKNNDELYGKIKRNNNLFNSAKLLVYIDKDKKCPNVGDYILIKGDISNFLKPTNPGQFDEYSYYVKQLKYKFRVFAKECKVIDRNLQRCSFKDKLYYNYKRKLYDIKDTLKIVIYKLYDKNMAGLISGIILGEKSLIDEETKSLYQEAGISHILAISGLHVTILGMCLYKILSKLRLNVYARNIFTIGLIISYGIMTNFTISTNRAVVMMVVMLSSRFFGRTYDIYSAMSLSLMIILIQNPLLIYNSGLIFSFCAVVGIVCKSPALGYIFNEKMELIKNRDNIMIERDTGQYDDDIVFDFKDIIRKVVKYAKKSLICSLAIYLTTLPIMINTYYSITVLSVFINILVLALAEILIITCFITSIVGFISVKLSYIFAGVPFAVLSFYEKLGNMAKSIGINNIIIGHRSMWQILLYYLVIACFVILILKNKEFNEHRKDSDRLKEGYNTKDKYQNLYKDTYKDKYIDKCRFKYLLVLLLCCVIFVKPNSKELKITMLDVSQGDGLCIQTPNNKVITIDGGSSDVKDLDKYRLVPFMKYEGISTIDYAVISHLDSDHFNGIKGIVNNGDYGIKIRNVVLPFIKEKSEEYVALENEFQSKGVNILYISKNNNMTIDGVKFTCLHPSKEYTSESSNGYSQVIHMSYGKFDMLFTGDLEEDGERLIIDDIKSFKTKGKNIDIIKVSHHGSSGSSSEEFIASINPKYALISAGKDNRYGHPHKETLDRYYSNGTKVYTTIDNGAISVESDGKKFRIS